MKNQTISNTQWELHSLVGVVLNPNDYRNLIFQISSNVTRYCAFAGLHCVEHCSNNNRGN